MRPLPIILLLSFAANVGLAFAWRSATIPEKPARQTAARQTKLAPASKDFDASRLAGAFKTDNYAEIFAQLRALGVDDMKARTITTSAIWSKYYSYQNKLLIAKNSNDALTWRNTGKTPAKSITQFTAAERKELRDLSNEARRNEIAVFGTTNVGGLEALAARYDFLPPEKIAQIEDLKRDYAEMSAEVTQESARFKLPSDNKQLKILHEEYRKDLASILTPEELAAYDRHFSSTALTLQRKLSNIDISDQEYLAIYDAVKSDGNKQSAAAIKSILGDDRYADYLRQGSSDYQTLLAAADRFNLPSATINDIYDLRGTVLSESQRIASDPTLSADEKRQELQDLAETMQSQVRAQMGDEIGNAYLQTPGMSWLQRMGAGASSGFSPNGGKNKRSPTKAPAVPSTKGKSKKKPPAPPSQ